MKSLITSLFLVLPLAVAAEVPRALFGVVAEKSPAASQPGPSLASPFLPDPRESAKQLTPVSWTSSVFPPFCPFVLSWLGPFCHALSSATLSHLLPLL